MRDCTPYRLRGLRPAPKTVHRMFQLLLILGLLAGLSLTSLHAQPGPGPDKKAPESPKPHPSATPAPAAQPAEQVKRIDVNFAQGQNDLSIANQRFQFKIDPKTPLKDLLPLPPKITRMAEPVRSNDLRRVPEVQFEALQGSANAKAMQHIAHQIAKINYLNNRKPDGFIEALRSERLDLTGLPFAMGDACRTKGERSKQFALAVATVRQALQRLGEPLPPIPTSTAQPSGGPELKPPPTPAGSTAGPEGGPSVSPRPAVSLSIVTAPQAAVDPVPPETFWDQYQTLCSQQDKERPQARREQRELTVLTRIAALTQILLPMTEMHPGLAKYLSTVSHAGATRALARLAIFSADENALKAAVEALKVRRERDYTEVLVKGLRYPWPAVARRAAEAIAKLERNDLLPQLIEVLEQDDPRAPLTRGNKGKSVPVVRELVRVNHHRSCLLCHAPGNTGKVSADAVTAEVPVPGQPLNPPSGGYNTTRQDILVRVDVTYLRQDFSAMQAVADANPWPEMQRFDFLVRSRVLSDEEVAAYREKLKPQEPGEFSPYHRAALAALRELTGRDTEPTPQAWRRLLKLPGQTLQKQKTS